MSETFINPHNTLHKVVAFEDFFKLFLDNRFSIQKIPEHLTDLFGNFLTSKGKFITEFKEFSDKFSHFALPKTNLYFRIAKIMISKKKYTLSNEKSLR